MGIKIKVKVDFRETVKQLNKLEKKQVPFATAKSLTELAKIGQRAVRNNLDKKFELRAKSFIKRNIRIIPAKKRDVNKLKAFSAVYTDDKITKFMVIHEEGGIRKSTQSKRLSIPSTDLQKLQFRKSTGAVKKKYQPRTLLKDFKGSRGKRGPRTRSRTKKPFIITGKGGQKLLVRRISKKRRPLELLYVFDKTIKITKRWGFEKTVRGIVGFKANRIFERNLNQALSTAH